jgi:hypothetical protein
LLPQQPAAEHPSAALFGVACIELRLAPPLKSLKDGIVFEIRPLYAKDISTSSTVKTENELALSPNTMFKVVALHF